MWGCTLFALLVSQSVSSAIKAHEAGHLCLAGEASRGKGRVIFDVTWQLGPEGKNPGTLANSSIANSVFMENSGSEQKIKGFASPEKS